MRPIEDSQRGVGEIFNNGMSARDPSMTIVDHVGDTKGYSGLISTSKRRFVADGFALAQKKDGWTYVIKDNGEGTAVKYTRKLWHLFFEREVVFDRIEPEQIVGAFTRDNTWIPNPNYGG